MTGQPIKPIPPLPIGRRISENDDREDLESYLRTYIRTYLTAIKQLSGVQTCVAWKGSVQLSFEDMHAACQIYIRDDTSMLYLFRPCKWPIPIRLSIPPCSGRPSFSSVMCNDDKRPVHVGYV